MSRILECCDGAEFGDTVFWSAINGTVTAADDQVYSGNYSYKLYGNTNVVKNIPAADEYYHRFAYRVNLPTTSAPLIWAGFYDATFMLFLVHDLQTGVLKAYRDYSTGGNAYTLLESSSISLSKDTWYLIELHIKIHETAGIFQVKVDGVEVIDFSGDTRDHPSYTTINNIRHYSSDNSMTIWLDDLTLNDTSGVEDNSWCGGGRYRLLKADGNGDVSQFMGSDGNSVDNYLLVDEVPPDGDTTYIEDSVTGHQDMVAVDDFVGTGSTILRAWCEVRARGTAPGEQLKLGVKTHGAVYVSSAIGLLQTYVRVIGDDMAVNPYTLSAWIDSDLDAAQAVVEIP